MPAGHAEIGHLVRVAFEVGVDVRVRQRLNLRVGRLARRLLLRARRAPARDDGHQRGADRTREHVSAKHVELYGPWLRRPVRFVTRFPAFAPSMRRSPKARSLPEASSLKPGM